MTSIRRVHPAWIVLGAVTVCMLSASGIRSGFGVYIKPMEAEFGWGRGALSGAAAVSLLLLGAVGPVVGRLADRWAPRRIVIIALLLLGIGSIGGSYVQKLWHVYVTTGFLMALGAAAARRRPAPASPRDGSRPAAAWPSASRPAACPPVSWS